MRGNGFMRRFDPMPCNTASMVSDLYCFLNHANEYVLFLRSLCRHLKQDVITLNCYLTYYTRSLRMLIAFGKLCCESIILVACPM